MTKRVATQIGIATGVNPFWLLLAGNEAQRPPRDDRGELMTKEKFEWFAGISPRMLEDTNTDTQISNLTFLIQALMRAAARKRRVPQCSYFLNSAIRDARKEFDLEKEMVQEMRALDPRHPLLPASPAEVAKLLKLLQSLGTGPRKARSAKTSRRPSV